MDMRFLPLPIKHISITTRDSRDTVAQEFLAKPQIPVPPEKISAKIVPSLKAKNLGKNNKGDRAPSPEESPGR